MLKQNKMVGIRFFELNLTLWVVLCMVAGVMIGKFLPAIPQFLSKFEYARVSIPIAFLIWLMIYPMRVRSQKAVTRKGLAVKICHQAKAEQLR